MAEDAKRCKRRVPAAIVWALLGISGTLYAQDADAPEMDFLEYLGMWEESDADWVLLSGDTDTRVAAEDSRTDPVPQGEESAEKEDES